MPGTTRLESVDVARALAALSVAIYHHGYGPGLVQITGIPAFSIIEWPGSQLAVPLFFVISGFCIHLGGLARQDEPRFTRTFFIHRFFRIYPPWVTALAVSILVARLWDRPVAGTTLLSHLTLTNGFIDDYRLNPVLWSVSVECLLYLLYPAWLALRRRHGLAAAFAVGLVTSAVSSAVTSLIQPVPQGPALWFFLNVWCGWLAGAVFAELLNTGGQPLLRRPVWWITGVVAIGLHVTAILAGVYRGPAAYAVLPVTIMLGVWPLGALIIMGEAIATRTGASWLRRGWRGLAGIGLFSYSLYLLHAPLQEIAYLILPHLTTAWSKLLLHISWLGVVLLASWLHYRWVEVPGIQWGRRILAQHRPPATAASVLRS